MKDLELRIDESNKLKFDLLIEGNIESESKRNFRLFLKNKNHWVVFEGEKASDGIEFIIPPLDMFDSGKCEMKFEAVIGNKHFVPMSLKANLIKKNISIKSESVSIETIPTTQQPPKEKIEIKSVEVYNDNNDSNNRVKKLTVKELKEILRKERKKC